jgi:hypothetical protein
VVGVVALVVGVATYLTWLAARVDRLTARAAAAGAALDAQLVRRGAAAARVAELLDVRELRYAARMAMRAAPAEREIAENDLTRALRMLHRPADSALLSEVAATSRRVALARHVHSDLVRDALAIRRRRLVRLLRIGHRQPLPRYFDIDDPILVGPVGADPEPADPGPEPDLARDGAPRAAAPE